MGLEQAPAMDRVDDSLSRVLVATPVSVLTDGECLARAVPPRSRPRGAPGTWPRNRKNASRAF